MKQSQKNISNRRDKIFNILLQEGKISVADVAETIGVSELTIRRDLDFFESKRLIERYYGGAKLVTKSSPIDANQRIELIKQEIAKKAAEFVSSGDIIFLNTSTTALYILKFLESKEVTVITNNAKAIRAITSEKTSLIFSGGELRSPKFAMTGDYALGMIDSIKASNSFLGFSGLSIEDGISTSMHSEVSINKKMMERTNGKKFILVDHTKFSHTARFSVAELSEINTIITDDLVPEDILYDLKSNFQLDIIQVSTKHINL